MTELQLKETIEGYIRAEAAEKTKLARKVVALCLENPQLHNVVGSWGWNALMIVAHHASDSFCLQCVKLLLNAGANVDLQEEKGWTALMHAARHCNSDSSIEAVQASYSLF